METSSNTSAATSLSSTSSSTTSSSSRSTSSIAYALSVVNINSLVPLVLDLHSANYSKWRGLTELTLRKFAISNHVSADAETHHDDDEWRMINLTVKSWMYATVLTEVLDMVMDSSATAYGIWSALECIFINNKQSRAIYLEADFRNSVQGDLSVTTYCARLKAMSDALRDIGQPVSDE